MAHKIGLIAKGLPVPLGSGITLETGGSIRFSPPVNSTNAAGQSGGT